MSELDITKNKPIEKLISLQILRGCAAWIVVFHHYVQSFYVGVNKTPSTLGKVFYNHGAFGVDIFFVLSGFIMYKSINNRKFNGINFGLTRLLRIMPSYWFFIAILILSLSIMPSAFLTNYDGITLIKSIFLIPGLNPNGYGYYPVLYVGWTLIFELFFYFILSISILINRTNALVIASLVLLSLGTIFRYDTFLGHTNILFLEFLIGIAVGYCYYMYKEVLYPFRHYISFISMILIVITNNIGGLNMIVAGLILTLFLLQNSGFVKFGKVSIFLSHLGDISYSTYLCHIIIIGWFYQIFKSRNPGISEFWILSFLSLITYLVSRISYHKIENAKYIKLIKLKIDQKFTPSTHS